MILQYDRCIPVPSGATKDTRVWVVDAYHNRVTNRKIGVDIMRVGHFPSCTVSVTDSKESALTELLKHRQAVLDDAKNRLAFAERSMKSAVVIAARDGVTAC